MKVDIRSNKSKCISNYVSTYKKGFYYNSTIGRKNGGTKQLMNNPIPSKYSKSESELDGKISIDNNSDYSIMYDPIQKISFDGPSKYLSSIEQYIPKNLISSQNFSEIKNLADSLTGDFTSFFGFESRLSSNKQRSDYLIAVSSKKGEREALLNLVRNITNEISEFNLSEWKKVGRLTEKWNDPLSELNKKILGLWLEFDTAKDQDELPIPSIFLQITPLRIDTDQDIEKCKWITQTAIPILMGHPVPEKVEKQFILALKNLPDKATVFHIAAMLSRNTNGIRLVIKNINPQDIISYLTSLGWSDQGDELSKMINEIKKYSNCIRLHININEKISSQIGLECFNSPDKYHKGQGWDNFLDYLIEKKACLPDKKSALLDFPGIDQESPDQEFDFESYFPTTKLPDVNYSKAIIRYISHIKISYSPGKPIEAKAYTGVRMFGKPR